MVRFVIPGKGDITGEKMMGSCLERLARTC